MLVIAPLSRLGVAIRRDLRCMRVSCGGMRKFDGLAPLRVRVMAVLAVGQHVTMTHPVDSRQARHERRKQYGERIQRGCSRADASLRPSAEETQAALRSSDP